MDATRRVQEAVELCFCRWWKRGMVCNRRGHTLLVAEVMLCMLNVVEGMGSVLYVAEYMRRVVVGLHGVGCRG